MKIYNFILSRIAKPSWKDLFIVTLVTLTFGNLTGEVISREYNAYLQASMMLITFFLGILTIRMVAVFIYNYINNKTT